MQNTRADPYSWLDSAEFGSQSPILATKRSATEQPSAGSLLLPTTDPAVRVKHMVPLSAKQKRWLENENLYHDGRAALGHKFDEWPPRMQYVMADAEEYVKEEGSVYVMHRGADAVGKVICQFWFGRTMPP